MNFSQLFAFLLLFQSGFSQVEKKALLWEIQDQQGKTRSYLFGTIHVMDENLFFLPKKLEKTLLKSKTLCIEVADLSGANLSMDKLMLKDKTINDIFSKEQLDTIHDWALRNLLMNQNQFDENFGQAKPFLLMQFVLQQSLPQKTKSYEIEFSSLAKINKQEIKGLETIDFQLSIFDNMPLKEQANMVMESLRDEKNAAKVFDDMQQIYLSQDLDSLFNFSKQESTLDNRDLLENRNIDWIPKMEAMMSNQIVFFAVGAAHLAGPEGVIELLIKKGYRLIPIKL